jgi:uncharacterized heparinase superfamily protein
LSTTYHAQLTEDLLDLVQMHRISGAPYPAKWDDTAQKALDWLGAMTRPDGRPPLFNDACYGVARGLGEIAGYATQLGFDKPRAPRDGLTHLVASGYFRYQTARYCLLGDVGPIGPDYIPGHAHCDMLSFELCVAGAPVVVDTGVSTYEAGERRALERSTASHNTVQLGTLEQSEMWGVFRVGRRARIRDVHGGRDFIEGSHDGFARHGCLHRRRFEFAPQMICITDWLTGKARNGLAAHARFHFAPGIEVKPTAGGASAGPIEISFHGATSIALGRYSYAPSFNVTQDAALLDVAFENMLTTKLLL